MRHVAVIKSTMHAVIVQEYAVRDWLKCLLVFNMSTVSQDAWKDVNVQMVCGRQMIIVV